LIGMPVRVRPGRAAATVALALAAATALGVGAIALTPEELAKACADAEGAAHCGRLVEVIQLKRLPNLAVRDGAVLRVSLYPEGSVSFHDADTPTGGKSVSLWDFLSEINAVVLYTTEGDDAKFTLLQRTNGRTTDLPGEPRLSPDRARLATADFCATRCTNELVVWRVTKDRLYKEYSWTPGERWDDSAVTWKTPTTLIIEYTRAGTPETAKLERKLTDTGWKHFDAP
jgi:hypothetical protein